MSSAVAYYRVSSKGQCDGDGWARQQVAVQQYAAAHGIVTIDEFRDEGVSGTNELMHRAGLTALSAYLEAHPDCCTILVERADRWARDLLVGELLLQEFRNRGIKVIACDADADLTENEEPTRVMVRQILGAVAQFMKSELVLKLRAARIRKKANGGKGEGPARYGATDEETWTMTQMLAFREAGHPYSRIAEMLNNEGYKPRHGTRWHAATVRKVLMRQESRT